MMILSTQPISALPGGALLLALAAMLLYAATVVPLGPLKRWSSWTLAGGWALHALLLVIDIGGIGQPVPGTHLGFAPVLSMTVWLVIAVHAIESRFVPLPSVRLMLAVSGTLAVLLTVLFPGELRPLSSALAPLHFALGVGSYGLFGAAVMHAVMLNQAESRLRAGGPTLAAAGAGTGAGTGTKSQTLGMPLLQLERLTFHFVEAGFAVLTATLLLGVFTSASSGRWNWDHKTVFSLLAWGVFAALVVGRRWRGWRGRRATRWLYAGALLLLLAYAGSRFVMEVLLVR